MLGHNHSQQQQIDEEVKYKNKNYQFGAFRREWINQSIKQWLINVIYITYIYITYIYMWYIILYSIS